MNYTPWQASLTNIINGLSNMQWSKLVQLLSEQIR